MNSSKLLYTKKSFCTFIFNFSGNNHKKEEISKTMAENIYKTSSEGIDEIGTTSNLGEKEKVNSDSTNIFRGNVDSPGLNASNPSADMLESLDRSHENTNELRRRREDFNYPPRYPDLQHSSLPEVRNADNHIDISPMDFGFVSESEDDTEDTDEFYEKPR